MQYIRKQVIHSLSSFLFLILLLFPLVAASSNAHTILKVSLSKESFNPALGEFTNIIVSVPEAGRILVAIRDRDGFAVRKISQNATKAGDWPVKFDGKDDQGVVLPPEAYTPRVDFEGARGVDTYDPSVHFHEVIENVMNAVYSRALGTITYPLSRTSRVHMQVGTATKDPKTGKPAGPVLRTVVDRKVRTAGTVVEPFDGLTLDGSVFIPDLPHFAIGILATSLPENSILVLGDESRNFREYARAHRPPSALQPRQWNSSARVMHHEGLTVFEDSSPDLKLKVAGTWDQQKGGWLVNGKGVLSVSPLDAGIFPFFLSQPTEVSIYVDEKLIISRKNPRSPFETTLDLTGFSEGMHVLAANWDSQFGPAGVGAVRIITGKQ